MASSMWTPSRPRPNGQRISLGDLPQTRLAGDCLSWLQSVTLQYLDLHNDLGLHLYRFCCGCKASNTSVVSSMGLLREVSNSEAAGARSVPIRSSVHARGWGRGARALVG